MRRDNRGHELPSPSTQHGRTSDAKRESTDLVPAQETGLTLRSWCRIASMASVLAALILTIAAAPSARAQFFLGDSAEGCRLEFRTHVPQNAGQDAPLVVALHGCDQSMADYERESGWSDLADRYGFIVLYAGQPHCNNPMGCFNWFDPAHIRRGAGEVAEIKENVDITRGQHSIDPDRIFVTGISAGAAMGVALLAAYPEDFAGGAVAASLPYRISTGRHDAFPSMLIGKDKTPQEWGDLVRETHPGYEGSYPTLAIFHGTADRAVNPVNMRELKEQWIDLHGIDLNADSEETLAGHTRKEYQDENGQARVVTYAISGMGHALPVDPGTGPGQGGATGKWSKDVDLYSSHHALVFWGLVTGAPETD